MIALAVILLLFWIVGLATHILGGLIHIALVLAVVFFLAHFLFGKRGAV